MYVFIYIYIYIYVFMHMCVYAGVCTHVCACIYVCVCALAYDEISITYTYLCSSRNTYIKTYLHT
jgi:hypothetical protein